MFLLLYCIHHIPSLHADSFPPLHDLRTYEFESDGLGSGQSMGSLQQSVKFWEDIGASGTVLDWIRYGVPLRWRSGPVRDSVLRNLESAMEHASFVDMALAELLAAGAVRHTSVRPAMVSPLGVVPKPNSKDKFRSIVNMRYVNQTIVVPKFRMETLSSLDDLPKSQDFMVSFDFKSGFWHIPLAPDAQ